MSAHDIEACRRLLVQKAAEIGVELTVSTAPPILVTPYSHNPMRCPHGTTFYMQPTNEQVAQWRRDGIQ